MDSRAIWRPTSKIWLSHFNRHGRKHTRTQTLTTQNVHDQLYVRAELLDVVEVGHRHYWHILVAVHLGDEVHVTGQVFPKASQRETWGTVLQRENRRTWQRHFTAMVKKKKDDWAQAHRKWKFKQSLCNPSLKAINQAQIMLSDLRVGFPRWKAFGATYDPVSLYRCLDRRAAAVWLM